jgi:hypothetical protein
VILNEEIELQELENVVSKIYLDYMKKIEKMIMLLNTHEVVKVKYKRWLNDIKKQKEKFTYAKL